MPAWTATSEALSGYATEINSEFMLVLGFYFAAPHLGKFAEGAVAAERQKVTAQREKHHVASQFLRDRQFRLRSSSPS